VTVDDEMWAFNQNERMGVLLIADPTVRPAVAMDLADQVLAAVREVGVFGVESEAAREAREARGGHDLRELRTPLGRRLRSVLHPDGKPGPETSLPPQVPAIVSLETVSSGAEAASSPETTEALAPADAEAVAAAGPEAIAELVSADAPAEAAPVDRESFEHLEPASPAHEDVAADTAPLLDQRADIAVPTDAAGDIDVVALAREFSGLLFDREDGAL
jgi:hypothetical protein